MTKHWQIVLFAITALITLGTTLKAIDYLEQRVDRMEVVVQRIPYMEGKLDVILDRMDRR